MTALIRHAKTAGNLKRKYIGVTDEHILKDTRIDAEYPEADIVISSPMVRCIETAKLIYPGREIRIYKGLAETDFGRFENRSYEELKDDRAYKEWLASNGTLPFPGGESPEEFRERCVNAYNNAVIDGAGKTLVFVVHGGTIMAVMSHIFGGGFYDYHADNLRGFMFEPGEGGYIPIP